MRFFYENYVGDRGYFSEKNLVKAIYTAWNIEATLYLLNDGIKKLDNSISFYKQAKCIFSPWEDNELNSELLEEYGYKMIDGKEYREIVDIKTNKIVRYDWAEVKQLV